MKYQRYNKRTRVKAILNVPVLREWMDQNDMTIDDLSLKSDVSSRTIKYWLKGRTVTLTNRKNLSKATGIEPKVLFKYTFIS